MQFGTALPRLLQRLVYSNPAHGPPLMCKIDLSDGYYRVPLSSDASLQLAVILPQDQTWHNLIAIPLSLPMGWKESPPYFCAFTKTISDSANNNLATLVHQYPEHPLLAPSQQRDSKKATQFHPTTVLPLGIQGTPPLSYTDVYMDDFCLLAQSPTQYRTLNTILHNIDAAFANFPHSPRRQVILQSKLEKGDAAWSLIKRLLGWRSLQPNISLVSCNMPLSTNLAHAFESMLFCDTLWLIGVICYLPCSNRSACTTLCRQHPHRLPRATCRRKA